MPPAPAVGPSGLRTSAIRIRSVRTSRRSGSSVFQPGLTSNRRPWTSTAVTVARRSLYGSSLSVAMSRGSVNVISSVCRSWVSARSACQCVFVSPSMAANGRRSGNCGKPGEDGAVIASIPSYTATVCPSLPRSGNGLSTAASIDGSSLAASTGPAFCAIREGTSTRRRFESVITTSGARAIAAGERSPA